MKRSQRYRIGALAMVLLAILLGVGVAAEQKVVLLNLTQPIEAQKSTTATAKFAELTQEAMKYGMADAYISGQVEYSMQPDRTIRSKILWSAISIENAGKKLTEGLESTLSSAFRVKETQPRAEPGTKLKAVGDVDMLATALGKLKAQLDAQGTPIQKETNNSKTQSQSVSPNVQAQDTGGQSKYLSDAGTPFNTVLEAGTSTTYTVCDDYFIDTASMKAVKQYKPVYSKGGVQTGEGVCAPNYSEFAAIKAKDGQCSYRFDFANSTAAKQEQLYYMSGATEILVGTCRDSNVTYPLFESRTGCPVVTDLANKKVFPQSKLAFLVGGLEQNATMCRAVSGTTGIPLEEEVCDTMFENDFVNHVSYLVTRMFYRDDQTGEKIYASTCGRSSTVSFPHVFDTSTCSWTMDDSKMLGTQKAKTIIRTGAIAGDVVVKECDTFATVAYTYIGPQTIVKKFGPGQGSWQVPVGVSTLHWVASAGGGNAPGSCNNDSYCVDGGGGHGNAGQAILKTGFTVTPGDTFSFEIGESHKPSKVAYAPTGGTVQNFNLATVSEPCPYPTWNGYVTGYCSTDIDGRNGLIIPNGFFGILQQSDNPKAPDGNPAPGCLPGVMGGKGGLGLGAGGGGGGGHSGCAGRGSAGLAGAIWFDYTVPKYMRPDGTVYVAPQN